MKCLLRISICGLFMLSSACGKIWVRPDSSATMNSQAQRGVSAERSGTAGYSKTTIGTATGAAIGAVTGLAIGSTSGNAGEGFVLGTAAGAMAGAGIGKALQGQEEKLVAQREVIRQQDELIKRQGGEIEDLRKNVIDGQFTIPPQNRSSLHSSSGRYDGNPEAQRFGGQVARARMNTERVRVPVKEFDLTEPVAPRSQQVRAEPTLAQPAAPAAVPMRVEGSTFGAGTAPMPTRETTTSVASNTTSGAGVAALPEPRLIGLSGQAQVSRPKAEAAPTNIGLGNSAKGTSVEEEQLEISATTPLPGAAQLPTASTNALPKAQALPTAKQSQPSQAAATQLAKKEHPKAAEVITAPKTAVAPENAKEKMPEPAAKTPQTQAATSAQGGDACSQAAQEASRGREATSDADKLFYFRRAIRLCPSEATYYVEVGRVYVSIGRTEDAQHEFNKALELDPENDAAQNELSMIMLGAAY